MSKNKYKNNDSINKKTDHAFAENESRDELETLLNDERDHKRLNQDPIETTYSEDDEKKLPEHLPHEMEAPSLDNDHYQRVDVWENPQKKVRPTSDIHPRDHLSEGVQGEYEGHLPTDVLPGAKIPDDYPSAESGYTKQTAQRGFPWWWILLPLVILGIIYGLTRNPINQENPPSSTTSQIPVEILAVEAADHLAAFDLV